MVLCCPRAWYGMDEDVSAGEVTNEAFFDSIQRVFETATRILIHDHLDCCTGAESLMRGIVRYSIDSGGQAPGTLVQKVKE